MSIIVDGYNYIGRSQELKLDDSAATDKVIYLMGQYCGRVKKTLTLVFDGNYYVHLANRKRRYGRVMVIYTSPIYTADHAIKKMVKNQGHRRRKSMLVVSSDGEILDYAKSHGAKVSKSEDFEALVYQELNRKKGIDRVNVQVTDEEVQEWLKIFGADPADTDEKNPQSRQKPAKEGKKAQQKAPVKQRKKKADPSSSTADDIDRVHVHLSSREVQDWMNIFGVEEDENE